MGCGLSNTDHGADNTFHKELAATNGIPSITYDDAPRAVLGCLQIATDYVLDSEGPALCSRFPGVEYRSQKIKLEGDCTTAENFEKSARNITDAVLCLQPPDRCTVFGISCTSMSFTLGKDAVDKLIKDAVPGVAVTDMARGQAEAIRVLGAKSVALFTPYIESVSLANVAMLEKCAGVEVVSRLTMGLERDEQSSLVSIQCIREWAKAVDVEGADLVVIGCSALRACPPNGFIDELEKELGKPVVTSTQAFMWIMLRTAGVMDKITGYGRLFREH